MNATRQQLALVAALIMSAIIVISIMTIYTVIPSGSDDIIDLREDTAKQLVRDAIIMYDQNSETAWDAITINDSFKQNGMYVFVVDDTQGIRVAHGDDASLIGVQIPNDPPPYDTRNIILNGATSEGSWVEYTRFYVHDENENQIKRTWLVEHDGYVFGSGYYP